MASRGQSMNSAQQAMLKNNISKQLTKMGYINPQDTDAANAARLSAFNVNNTVGFLYPRVASGNPAFRVAQGSSNGGMIYAAEGTMVNYQPRGTDTVPAMLTPGEFVVNAKATSQHLPLLQAINKSKGGVLYRAAGGETKSLSPTQASSQIRDRDLNSRLQQEIANNTKNNLSISSKVSDTTKNTKDQEIPKLLNNTENIARNSTLRFDKVDSTGQALVKNTDQLLIASRGFSSGGMVYASNGKLINYQPRGTDTVPAMLTPGEFVVNRAATQANLPLLQAINKSKGGNIKKLAEGGIIYAATGTEIPDGSNQSNNTKNTNETGKLIEIIFPDRQGRPEETKIWVVNNKNLDMKKILPNDPNLWFVRPYTGDTHPEIKPENKHYWAWDGDSFPNGNREVPNHNPETHPIPTGPVLDWVEPEKIPGFSEKYPDYWKDKNPHNLFPNDIGMPPWKSTPLPKYFPATPLDRDKNIKQNIYNRGGIVYAQEGTTEPVKKQQQYRYKGTQQEIDAREERSRIQLERETERQSIAQLKSIMARNAAIDVINKPFFYDAINKGYLHEDLDVEQKIAEIQEAVAASEDKKFTTNQTRYNLNARTKHLEQIYGNISLLRKRISGEDQDKIIYDGLRLGEILKIQEDHAYRESEKLRAVQKGVMQIGQPTTFSKGGVVYAQKGGMPRSFRETPDSELTRDQQEIKYPYLDTKTNMIWNRRRRESDMGYGEWTIHQFNKLMNEGTYPIDPQRIYNHGLEDNDVINDRKMSLPQGTDGLRSRSEQEMWEQKNGKPQLKAISPAPLESRSQKESWKRNPSPKPRPSKKDLERIDEYLNLFLLYYNKEKNEKDPKLVKEYKDKANINFRNAEALAKSFGYQISQTSSIRDWLEKQNTLMPQAKARGGVVYAQDGFDPSRPLNPMMNRHGKGPTSTLPQQPITNFDSEKLAEESKAFMYGAAKSILPGLAGLGAGVLGLPTTGPGGFAIGLGAGAAVYQAQENLLNALAPETSKNINDTMENNWQASLLGSMAGGFGADMVGRNLLSSSIKNTSRIPILKTGNGSVRPDMKSPGQEAMEEFFLRSRPSASAPLDVPKSSKTVPLFHASNTGLEDSILKSFQKEGGKSGIAKGYGQGAGLYTYTSREAAEKHARSIMQGNVLTGADARGKPMIVKFDETLDSSRFDLDYELNKSYVARWLHDNFDQVQSVLSDMKYSPLLKKLELQDPSGKTLRGVQTQTFASPNSGGAGLADSWLMQQQTRLPSRRAIYDSIDSVTRDGEVLSQIMKFIGKRNPEMLQKFREGFFETMPPGSAIKYIGSDNLVPSNIDVLAKARGGMVYANNGMLIPYQPRGTDTVPAMLTPGEFVVNRQATQQNLPLLQSINGGATHMSRGGSVYLADGGSVPGTGSSTFNFGQIFITLSQTTKQFTNSLQLAVNSLSEYQKQLSSTTTNSVSNNNGSNTLNMDGLSQFTSTFNKFIGQLEQIKIPEKVNLQGTHRVDVVINGASVFSNMQEPIQRMITQEVDKAMNNLSRKTEGVL
jgi:hypothetical protein